MNAKKIKYDDLTSIKGIGHTRQEWFKNKLGVHTYQNLAMLSPDKILAQLRSDGMIASRGEVEKWIVQAQELADQKGNISPGDWEPFASFVVEFQSRRGKTESKELCTTVQHMEADKEEKWPGIETEQLCHWMRERVGKEVPAMEDQPMIGGKVPAIKDQVQVRKEVPEMEKKHQIAPSPKLPSITVNQVQAFQPPQAEKPTSISMPGQPFQGFIRSDKPFDLLETFSIIGLDPGDFQQRKIPYFVQFYARELPLGKWIHLGDTDPLILVEGQESYTAILTGISLPTGMYLLKVLTRIPSKPPVFIHHEVPMLQVV